MAKSKSRGSELLQLRWAEEELVQLVEFEDDGVELVEFFPKGIPVPDGAWGTWRVHRKSLEALIGKLIAQPQVPTIRVFPKGIPHPDLFDVVFEAGSARVR